MMKSTVALKMAMVVAVATTMTIAVAKKTVLNDAASFPDVSLVFEGQERAQRTKGRGKASPLSLSHGPSRFVLVTSRTCFTLALTSPFEASEEAGNDMYCNVWL